MAVAAHLPPPADRTGGDAPGRTGAPAPAAGRLGPRRGLPGGRAIVGGLLVAAAGLGTFAVASGAGRAPVGSVVVAARDVAPGAVLDADDLALAAGAVPEGVAGRAFTRVEDVVGAVAVGPLGEGELVQAGALAEGVGGGVPTLSVALETAAADGGALERGDRVQVLATYGSDAAATTVALSAAADVVAVEAGGDGLASGGQVLVRLAVDDAEERSAIVTASVAGRLALVRTTGAPGARVAARYRPPVADPAADPADPAEEGADR